MSATAASRRLGLPRARGDGPTDASWGSTPGRSPPRARGWSLRAAHEAVGVDVSPARAGMVPPPPRPPVRRRCLPRARGDGPAGYLRIRMATASPPRARGWSRAEHRPEERLDVSPARAGMVPPHRAGRHHRPRLPRARGDGPIGTGVSPETARSPPRARGWSLHRRAEGQARRVSPARAGMVPSTPRHAGQRTGLPRARGDGPLFTASPSLAPVSPPRARGWSRDVALPGDRGRVSPARAGMVPALSARDVGSTRLPRARGDGPVVGLAMPMLPRSPPRARGWSLSLCKIGREKAVSPARAGMVPRRESAPWPFAGLPRARGDGPEAYTLRYLSFASPPRARGWSRAENQRLGLLAVSPARAGMVPPMAR